jgi:hypothetical protein
MRRRRGSFEVFSLSAVDLFASAMGAFVILSIILMPDYQKEVRAQGDQFFLAELAGKTQAILQESEQGRKDTLQALQAAQARHEQLAAEQQRISAELQTINAENQARADEPPPPPPTPVEVPEPTGSHLVTFRFLGLKTDKSRILFLVDMNKFLAPHSTLVRQTVIRAMNSLEENYQFSILGFQQQDSGPKYYRWPAGGDMAFMTDANRAAASQFLLNLGNNFKGSSPVVAALDKALNSEAEAILLFSDGLPNPAYNEGLSSKQIVRRIIQMNKDHKEIHAVTIGDYFKYRGTIEFMESLAKNNAGGFLALSD